MKLEKLTVAIKNVRPLVISEQMAADLNDFLQLIKGQKDTDSIPFAGLN